MVHILGGDRDRMSKDERLQRAEQNALSARRGMLELTQLAHVAAGMIDVLADLLGLDVAEVEQQLAERVAFRANEAQQAVEAEREQGPGLERKGMLFDESLSLRLLSGLVRPGSVVVQKTSGCGPSEQPSNPT